MAIKDNFEREVPFYKGHAILKNELTAETADENYYHFIGKNSVYPFSEIVHPDDRERFLDAFMKAQEGIEDSFLYVKCKDENGNYYPFSLQLSHNKGKVNGVSTVNMILYEYIPALIHYEEMQKYVRKYRKFMTLSSDRYFEYEQDTDLFKIYEYQNQKNVMLVRESLSIWEKRTIDGGIISEKDLDSFKGFVRMLRNGARNFSIEFSMKNFWEEDCETPVLIRGDVIYLDSDDKLTVGTISPLKRFYQDEMENNSDRQRDALTGLLNKMAIRNYTERLMEASVPKPFFFAIIDIDDFKIINDRYGHMMGDRVITKIANLLNSVILDRGMNGRFGGDEFVSVVNLIGNPEKEIRNFMKTVQKRLHWETEHDQELQGIHITLSIGVAQFPTQGKRYEELFQVADKALYIAKAKGKARYIIYDEEKHGKMDTEQDGQNQVRRDSEEKNAMKFAAITSLIMELHQNGIHNIDEIMCILREYFEIDAICILQGEDLKMTHWIGDYSIPGISMKPLATEHYFEEKEDGYVEFCCNNVEGIHYSYPVFYQRMKDQGVSGTLQIGCITNRQFPVIVCFDILNRSKKWSESEKNVLSMMGKIITNHIYESQIDGNS